MTILIEKLGINVDTSFLEKSFKLSPKLVQKTVLADC